MRTMQQQLEKLESLGYIKPIQRKYAKLSEIDSSRGLLPSFISAGEYQKSLQDPFRKNPDPYAEIFKPVTHTKKTVKRNAKRGGLRKPGKISTYLMADNQYESN